MTEMKRLIVQCGGNKYYFPDPKMGLEKMKTDKTLKEIKTILALHGEIDIQCFECNSYELIDDSKTLGDYFESKVITKFKITCYQTKAVTLKKTSINTNG